MGLKIGLAYSFGLYFQNGWGVLPSYCYSIFSKLHSDPSHAQSEVNTERELKGLSHYISGLKENRISIFLKQCTLIGQAALELQKFLHMPNNPQIVI